MSDKQKPVTLAEAKQALADAQNQYHALTRQRPAADKIAAHQAACAAALAEKRYRAAVLEAVTCGRAVPNKADLIECRIG